MIVESTIGIGGDYLTVNDWISGVKGEFEDDEELHKGILNLIVKKEQAKISLLFIDTFTRDNYEGVRLKEATHQNRKKLKNKLQSMTLKANYKGKKNVS